jgi:hypothetical protein
LQEIENKGAKFGGKLKEIPKMERSRQEFGVDGGERREERPIS